jgi:hypothetical protein
MLLLGAIMVLAAGFGHGLGFAPMVLLDIDPPDIAPPDMAPPDIEFPDIELPAMLLPVVVFTQCFVASVVMAPPDMAPPDIALSANAGAPINRTAAAPIKIKRDMYSSKKLALGPGAKSRPAQEPFGVPKSACSTVITRAPRRLLQRRRTNNGLGYTLGHI